MNPCTLREILEADAEEWKRLRLEALRSEPQAFAMSPEAVEQRSLAEIAADIRKWQETGGFAVGAFADSAHLMGMAAVSRSDYPKLHHRGHIWGVYVTPSMRGKGIAKHLLAEIIQRARCAPGLVQLEIESVTSNPRANQIYHSIGFRVTGLQPRAIKVGEDYLDEHLLVYDLA